MELGLDSHSEEQKLDLKSAVKGGGPHISIGQASNVNVGNNCKVVIGTSKAKRKSSHRKREIPSQYPLTTSDEPLTMNQKLDIKDKVGRHWKDLGRRLGIVDSELEQLEMENTNNYPEVVYQILSRWEQCVAHRATQEALAIVFQKLRRGDLSDLLAS